MRLKLFEIINIYGALTAISKQELPVSVGFKFAVNAKRIEPLIAAHQTATRELVDRFAKKDDGGNPIFLPNGQPLWGDRRGETELLTLNETIEDVECSKLPVSSLETQNFPWPVIAALLPMIDNAEESSNS